MGRRRVTLDQFGEALSEILSNYADGVYATEQKAVTASTKQALREERAASGQFGSRYSGDWRSRVERTNVTATGVVYNARAGLPHLLEKGHIIANAKRPGAKRRTEARPHVLPVQESVNKLLMQKLEEGLNK